MTDLTQAAVAVKTNPTNRDLVQKMRDDIGRQLAGFMDPDAFVRTVLSEISNTPQLGLATPASLLGAVMLAAQLHLEIGRGMGEFWLTPRRDHGTQVCVPVIGYQGIVKLALRSPLVLSVEAFLVRDGDTFTYGANSERGRFFDWQPLDFDESRDWTHAVAVARLAKGGTAWWPLTRAEVEARRPNNWQKTPWATNPEPMARKTAVRALAPYLPKSTQLGQALAADEQVVMKLPGVEELSVTPDPDDTDDNSSEAEDDYEARAAAEFDAAVERGEA